MSDDSHGRLTALMRLAKRVTEGTAVSAFDDALTLVIDVTKATAGAFLLDEEELAVVAQRGFGDKLESRAPRDALRGIGQTTLAAHRSLLIADVVHPSSPIPGVEGLGRKGAALAVPLEHIGQSLGALVLLADAKEDLDPAVVTFVEAVCQTLSLAIHRDRNKEAERARREELAEANRMASLGLLTASVAHELRGPVGALVLQLEEQQRLLDEAEQDPLEGGDGSKLVGELGELTADISTALSRIRSTIDQLSRLSRRDSEPEQLDLSEVVSESLAVARPYLRRRGIALQEELSVAQVKGRRDNLGQVLLNLVFNAADACQGAPGERKVMVSVVPDKHQIVLQVDDTGPGIPPHTIEKIFTPFFTTKQRGKGIGLGLKICSDVVTAHGGHIEVVNRAGGGASFRVMLPSLTPRVPVDRPSKRVPPTSALPKLMVIDDDPVFTRTVRRGLKECDVQTAPSASDAEMALTSAEYVPDLVLCDVFLPGLNGHLLHERINKINPDLASRFVFVTGGALSKEEADYLRSSGCPTLFKPLNLDHIREILSDRGPESTRNLRTLQGPPDTQK